MENSIENYIENYIEINPKNFNEKTYLPPRMMADEGVDRPIVKAIRVAGDDIDYTFWQLIRQTGDQFILTL